MKSAVFSPTAPRFRLRRSSSLSARISSGDRASALNLLCGFSGTRSPPMDIPYGQLALDRNPGHGIIDLDHLAAEVLFEFVDVQQGLIFMAAIPAAHVHRGDAFLLEAQDVLPVQVAIG